MKVKDLSGKEHHLDIRASQYKMKTEKSSKSKIQFACGQLIRKKFPFDVILEEVSIPGEKLYIDFLIPQKRIAFEIQGRQHESYVPFFHGSESGFDESLKRDSRKKHWCEINDIELYTTDSENGMREILGL